MFQETFSPHKNYKRFNLFIFSLSTPTMGLQFFWFDILVMYDIIWISRMACEQQKSATG